MDNQTPNTPRPMNDEGSVGPVIATIIILAVIVLGGLYFWHERNLEDEALLDGTTLIETQSSADDTDSINADLNSTDTMYIDSGMNAS